jgi:hypothetical protein
LKYHCGILDDRPEYNRTLKWIRGSNWKALPDDVAHELKVWLAMPGFPYAYHARQLSQPIARIKRWSEGYYTHREAVVENWVSATREDCIKLAHLRRPWETVPLICQIQAVEDLKHMTARAVAKEYGVFHTVLAEWWHKGFNAHRVPDDFKWLVSRTS